MSKENAMKVEAGTPEWRSMITASKVPVILSLIHI